MWVWPQVPVGGTSPPPPCATGSLAHARPGSRSPGALQKEPRGLGEGGGVGREGLWLEGRVLLWNGGGTAKGHLGPDPHLGALDPLKTMFLEGSVS